MMLTRYEPWGLHRELLNAFAWTPPVGIDEQNDKFVLRADVPGVDPSSIEITLENGVLTLAGSRDDARFERRFSLPDSADAEGIKASGKHGVLEVVIPKRAAAQARRIVVS